MYSEVSCFQKQIYTCINLFLIHVHVHQQMHFKDPNIYIVCNYRDWCLSLTVVCIHYFYNVLVLLVCVCVQAPPHGVSYDQSQVGMLSVSFLDATQYPSIPHLSHPHPSHPHPPPLPQHVDLSVASLDHSLLPVSISNLPALQGARVMWYSVMC